MFNPKVLVKKLPHKKLPHKKPNDFKNEIFVFNYLQ